MLEEKLMKKILLTIVLPVALLGLMIFQGGCVKENFDTIPRIKDTSELVANIKISDLKSITDLANVKQVKDLVSPSLWQTIYSKNKANGISDTTLIVIEGYITTSDSTGNFYEVFSMQDVTGGIDVKINTRDLYALYRFKPGQKVMIKVNNLYLGNYKNTYQLGYAILNQGAYKMVGLPEGDINKYIERTGWRKAMIPETVEIADLLPNDDPHLQKLVCINNIQFKEPYNGYSIPGTATSRTLVDNNGNTIILRTSGFATFANSSVAPQSGTITGLLTSYSGTKQIVIRDLNDVKFDQPRFGATAPTPNTTIAELKAMVTTIDTVPIKNDIVVSGVITGNDKSGNIYKYLFIQDNADGIQFNVDVSGLNVEYPVGTKIAVACKGMYVGKTASAIQLGYKYKNGNKWEIGRLSGAAFNNSVFTIGAGFTVNPLVTSISNFNYGMIGKLITLDDVEFISTEEGKPWAEASATTNRLLEDMLSYRVIVRTSNYADFASSILPSYRGRITAILTKYNNDYQLTVRELGDVRMNKSRFNFLLSQDFNSASLGSPIAINGWKSIATAGTRNWLGMSSSINGTTHYYAELNANNSSETNNVSWLISPQVNIANAGNKILFFQTAFNNWVGNGILEAFISTNFNGTDVAAATWTPIQGIHIAQQADGATSWVNSGNIDLSQYNSNIYIGFKYTSAGGSSATAFRVDNVKIY